MCFKCIIQNASDNVQFLYVVHTNICFCHLVNIDATLPSYIAVQLLLIVIRQMAAANVHATHA